MTELQQLDAIRLSLIDISSNATVSAQQSTLVAGQLEVVQWAIFFLCGLFVGYSFFRRLYLA